jgi:hypothetical protein
MSQLGLKAGVVYADLFASVSTHSATLVPRLFASTPDKMSETPVRLPDMATGA